MKVKVLASGSDGNVTVVRSGDKMILIDCGKSYTWVMGKLNHELPDAVLITHEHCDHSHAVKQFLKRQVRVYMTRGTADALKLEWSYNLHIIVGNNPFVIGELHVYPFPAAHDAKEPVNFILVDFEGDTIDRVLFVTDTGKTPPVTGTGYTKIFIEANYSTPVLMQSDLEPRVKERILNNHLSIENAMKFLANHPNAEKTLLHISKRHGNEAEFYRRIRNEEGESNLSL